MKYMQGWRVAKYIYLNTQYFSQASVLYLSINFLETEVIWGTFDSTTFLWRFPIAVTLKQSFEVSRLIFFSFL